MNKVRMQYGWLDTTVFLHVLFENDPHRQRCMEILKDLEGRRAEGWIDPVVLHELTYVLPRCQPRFRDRRETLAYLMHFLLLDSLHAENKVVLTETLQEWARGNAGFADARLRVLAKAHAMPVCTVNEGDFPGVSNSFTWGRQSAHPPTPAQPAPGAERQNDKGSEAE